MKESRVRLFINGTQSVYVPNYSDTLAIKIAREDNEMYRRTTIDNTFTFTGGGYDAINNASIDATFEIKVYDEETNTLLATGSFEKTDCEFDTDNKICTVKVDSADTYSKILDGKDNEYDLISLAPVREHIQLFKRGVLQLYFLKDNKLTNLIGGMSYEVDVASSVTPSTLTDYIMQNTYNFEPIIDIVEGVTVSAIPATVGHTELLGTYYGAYTGSNTRFIKEDGQYTIEVIGMYSSFQERTLYGWGFKDSNGEVVKHNDQPIMAEVSATAPTMASISNWGEWIGGEQGGWISYIYLYDDPMTVAGIINTMYARILTDATTGVALPTNDICNTNFNYHYSIKPTSLKSTLLLMVIVSSDVQDDPTEWGVDGDGKYFVKPSPIGYLDNVVPIGWNRWIPNSYWFNIPDVLTTQIESYSVWWTLKDAIPLWSAIKILLAQIDSTISFDGTSEYSQFLYGTIPASSEISRITQRLYITPITNVKKTYYSQAARKGTITLGQILDMLKNTCQLYWFIDSSKRLRIEHITWFKNGGSYTSASTNVLMDLTTITAKPIGKTWDFGQNIYKFDTKELIKRYEFEWNDKASDVFEGFPIDIKNKFVKGGKTNNASVSNFDADLDMIISAPDTVSDDCFALIGIDPENKRCWTEWLNYYSTTFKAPKFKPQNAYLSFFFLEWAYWRNNLSGDSAKTTTYKTTAGADAVVDVLDTMNIKTQTVKFPMPVAKVGQEGLITTGVGTGEWISETYTPEDGMVEVEILIDDSYVPTGTGAYDASFDSSFAIDY